MLEKRKLPDRISPEESKKILDSNQECILLDVREQNEYQESHIPGALLLNVADIETKAEALLPNKDILYIVYCRTGQRAMNACMKLEKLGYKNV
ncbi:MAG: rhodanese-like domain-containing protein, partial [Bacillota bacterium]|nr:rhodanese-like domain-containing protein [Bacillota bacterium]